MHAFTAPAAGSGKSMLVDLCAILATGREAPVIAQGANEEEMDKRLGAVLLCGDAILSIDNCELALGGEFLCQMLTQTLVRPRILGKSEAPELPPNLFMTATGNNLRLVGDMTRRALLCKLDPQVERPELRTFRSKPLAIAKAQRGALVVAALTVLRAYIVAGRPQRVKPLGSFEQWSDLVRSALVWLGHADPVDTIEQARGSDPRLDEMNAVVAQWSSVIGTDPVTVRKVIERATERRPGVYEQGEFVCPDFREALLAVAGRGGAINTRALGTWLASKNKRITGGQSFEQVGSTGGAATWRLARQGG